MTKAANRPHPILMLSTCGTSILTNGVDDETRRRLNRLANATAEALSPEERRFLDEHIAQRSRQLEQASLRRAQGRNPHSLDFKPLQDNQAPPSTHECDAWADGAAMRILSHFDDKIFVVDCLHKHL